MRLSALVTAAILAALVGTIAPAAAVVRLARPDAGPEVVMRVDGRPRRMHRLRLYHYHRGFFADGYYRMYVLHHYPRGIIATFGYPRCFCQYDW